MGAVGGVREPGGSSGALGRCLPLLRCPVCGRTLGASTTSDTGRLQSIGCPAGHSFDVAKQGYVTLLGGKGRTIPGDSAAQVMRRERFLDAGHFAAIAERLAARAEPLLGSGSVVFDCGAGTGYYLAHILDAAENADGIGSEISVPAARRLARAHPRAAAIVADTRDELPLEDRSVDVVVVVFAPRNVAEFHRILRPGGTLLVVWPGPDHLLPLRDELGLLGIEGDKEQRMLRELAHGFDVDDVEIDTVREPMQLTDDAAAEVAMMGPSGFHVDEAELMARITALPRLEAMLDVRIGLFSKR